MTIFARSSENVPVFNQNDSELIYDRSKYISMILGLEGLYVLISYFHDDNDEKNAKRIAAGTVAFYASVKTYDEFFTSHGFGAEAEII